MKVNINNEQKIVTGIYKYEQGIQYTKGDFVIKDDSIYYVNTDVNGDENIASDKYIEYTLINAIKDTNELDQSYDNKLVTSNVLKSIINKYINGLNYGGEVSKIVAGSNNSLDNIKTTCIRCIEVPIGTDYSVCGLPELIDPTRSYKLLFRSFKLVTDHAYIVQELTDFDNGVIFTRSASINNRKIDAIWNTFYSVNYQGASSGINDVITNLRATYDELNSLFSEVNRYTMVELFHDSGSFDKTCHLSDLKLTNVKLLDIIVKYRSSSDEPYTQDIFRVNLTSGSQSIERTIYEVHLVPQLSGGINISIVYQGSSFIESTIHFDKIIGIKYL